MHKPLGWFAIAVFVSAFMLFADMNYMEPHKLHFVAVLACVAINTAFGIAVCELMEYLTALKLRCVSEMTPEQRKRLESFMTPEGKAELARRLASDDVVD